MSENGGYATFALYHTLHLHFTQKSYNYFKYHGKCNIGKDAFLNRRDKYIFYAISRKYNLEDAKQFFIANLLHKPKAWIGELNSVEADEVYLTWKKRNQALTYTFEQDIISLFDSVETPNDLLVVRDGQEPKLLKELYYENIAPETLIILNRLLNFFDMWDEKIQDDIVYPAAMFKLKKYEPFVDFDVAKFKKILTSQIKAHK
jgi:T4 gene Gp59 loader of gp41 DNA helicase/T4 gene Gp59 loader of gp41 DNA helicase C-term